MRQGELGVGGFALRHGLDQRTQRHQRRWIGDAVDAFHAAALKAGGSDNGKPGLRADYGPNYYAAFVVDPDGYRLEAYCGAEA